MSLWSSFISLGFGREYFLFWKEDLCLGYVQGQTQVFLTQRRLGSRFFKNCSPNQGTRASGLSCGHYQIAGMETSPSRKKKQNNLQPVTWVPWVSRRARRAAMTFVNTLGEEDRPKGSVTNWKWLSFTVQKAQMRRTNGMWRYLLRDFKSWKGRMPPLGLGTVNRFE